MLDYKQLPTDYNIPAHMTCKLCGMCSTALNPQRICWRHEEYKNGSDVDYYFGKPDVSEKKDLPIPIKEMSDG